MRNADSTVKDGPDTTRFVNAEVHLKCESRLGHAASAPRNRTPRPRERGGARPVPRAGSRRTTAGGQRRTTSSSSSDDPGGEEPAPALAGPSPRFSHPWRAADRQVADYIRAHEARDARSLGHHQQLQFEVAA